MEIPVEYRFSDNFTTISIIQKKGHSGCETYKNNNNNNMKRDMNSTSNHYPMS